TSPATPGIYPLSLHDALPILVAYFDLGFKGHPGFTCEALAWRDGRPWRGVDPRHPWLPIASPEIDFYLEASAIPTAVVSGPAEADRKSTRLNSSHVAISYAVF